MFGLKKTALKKYARLIVHQGINLRKGQDVIIFAELDQPEFVTMVLQECYKSGARKVEVRWSHQPCLAASIKGASLKTLSEVPEWERARLEEMTKNLPCRIFLLSEDPDGLAKTDQGKYVKAMQARYKITKPYRDAIDNRHQWCIAGVPGKAWAHKVFPNVSKAKAQELLWDAILETSRAKGDPIANWQAHNEDLASRCRYLNSKGIASLHYKAGNGTDFKVGLIENSVFLAGGEYTLAGIFFNANIPSEEVFITPKKGEAEGIVYSSRPFSYNGKIIDNFSLTFKDGKVVKATAEKGEELLNELINMDEGAAYLGEIALVPFDSPISNSGILFYNTLFDENAACHIALGEGFTNCIKDFEKYQRSECKKMGINDSAIHEDLMIGTPDLCITGILKTGEEIPIFKDGNWAF